MVERQSRWRWLRAVGGGVGAAALATGVLVSTAGVAHASTAAPTSSSSQGASAVLPVQ